MSIAQAYPLPDGVTLHVVEGGNLQGRPLVFIHGVMMSGRFFSHQINAFPDYHVIVPDMRGHGESDKVLAGHTVASYARDVHALLTSLGQDHPVLAGWSMGAMVVWEYLHQFGNDSIQAAILIDQPPSDFGWPNWEFGALPIEALRDMVEAIQTDRRPVLEAFRSLMVHDPNNATDWMLDEMEKISPVTATTILCNQTFQDYRDLLPSLTVPTLVCFGGDDKLTSPKAGQYIVEHMPNASLRIFSASSHMPFLEEPGAFNGIVHQFLQTL